LTREIKLFAGVLVGAMAASSFSLFALSVLASDLIDEFDISRGQLGLLATANTATGAILAPSLGRLTDRIGGRRSMLALLGLTVVGFTAMALAKTYLLLTLGVILAGIPQGWGNPATNKLIVERLAEGSRGVVVGIKQSGVQVGVFLAGITLPLAANTVGWRWGIAAYAIVTVILMVLTAATLAPDTPDNMGTISPSPQEPVTPIEMQAAARATLSRAPVRLPPPLVVTVAIYATLLGIVGGGVNRFIPLFAHEELGYSTTVAGLAAALTGLLAIGARIWWSHRAEVRGDTVSPLVQMAVGSAAVALMLAAASSVGAFMLWPIAILGAFSVSAWNSVAMLRVLNGVPSASTGRASGIVLSGFLGGLAIGAPVVGWSVDQWNSYTPAWFALAFLALVAALVARSRAEPSTS